MMVIIVFLFQIEFSIHWTFQNFKLSLTRKDSLLGLCRMLIDTESFEATTLYFSFFQDEQNKCYQPKLVGRCEAMIPRYFFNSESHRCEKFSYGGCQGNGNRFSTLKDCQISCGKLFPIALS